MGREPRSKDSETVSYTLSTNTIFDVVVSGDTSPDKQFSDMVDMMRSSHHSGIDEKEDRIKKYRLKMKSFRK